MYIYVLHANRCSFDKGSINMCVFLTHTHMREGKRSDFHSFSFPWYIAGGRQYNAFTYSYI